MAEWGPRIFVVIVICSLLGCAGPKGIAGRSLVTDPVTERRIDCLREKLKEDPNNVELLTETARILLGEGMIEDAMEKLETARGLDPERVDTLVLLSLAFQKLPRPETAKALTLLHDAEKIEPENPWVRLNLARVYSDRKDGRAVDEFEKALELSDEVSIKISARLGLMTFYRKQGEERKAEEQYREACLLDPGVSEMVKQSEINRLTPPPRYGGGNEGDSLHPTYEKRMENIKRKIGSYQGGESENCM